MCYCIISTLWVSTVTVKRVYLNLTITRNMHLFTFPVIYYMSQHVLVLETVIGGEDQHRVEDVVKFPDYWVQ
jgi:hypothetical protein